MVAMGCILVAITPLYDGWLLHAPAAFNRQAHLIQFGLEIPCCLLALATMLWPRARPWSQWFVAICITAVALGMVWQRTIGIRYSFVFPHNFVGLPIIAGFLLSGLRLFFFLPWAVFATVAACIADVYSFGPSGSIIYGMVSNVMLLALATVGGYYVEHLNRRSWLQRKLLESQAVADPLTGLYNRREFSRISNGFVRQAARDNKPVAVMMLDVDCFKAYNDHYGHAAGDVCLQKIGEALSTAARRPLDLHARIGGEEFAVIWFDADAPSVERLTQRVVEAVAGLAIPHQHSVCANVVTASVGALWCRPACGTSVDELLAKADALLYRAKHSGRNQACFEQQ
jgi:diguanylate cyclase (GGDEF)-like protein